VGIWYPSASSTSPSLAASSMACTLRSTATSASFHAPSDRTRSPSTRPDPSAPPAGDGRRSANSPRPVFSAGCAALSALPADTADARASRSPSSLPDATRPSTADTRTAADDVRSPAAAGTTPLHRFAAVPDTAACSAAAPAPRTPFAPRPRTAVAAPPRPHAWPKGSPVF
jgi:hypothetical protein